MGPGGVEVLLGWLLLLPIQLLLRLLSLSVLLLLLLGQVLLLSLLLGVRFRLLAEVRRALLMRASHRVLGPLLLLLLRRQWGVR